MGLSVSLRRFRSLPQLAAVPFKYRVSEGEYEKRQDQRVLSVLLGDPHGLCIRDAQYSHQAGNGMVEKGPAQMSDLEIARAGRPYHL